MLGEVRNKVDALTGHVSGHCQSGGRAGGRAWCQNAAKKPPPCQIRRMCLQSPFHPLCWRYALQAWSKRAQPLGHGLPALKQTLAARRSVTGSTVGAGQLHPATVVATGLLDHPVGVQCMQTGHNTYTAGRMATCNTLTCQNQTAIHHMGRRLRNRQRFVWTSGNALTTMVAHVGVEAQPIVVLLPGVLRTDIHAGLTVAIHNSLMDAALGMDG